MHKAMFDSFYFCFLKKLIYFMCVCFACTYVCVCYVHAWCLRGQSRVWDSLDLEL